MASITEERSIALINGKKTFMSSNPCKHGHLPTKRYTRSGLCTECQRLATIASLAKSHGLQPLAQPLKSIKVFVANDAHADQVRAFADMLCGRSVNAKAAVPLMPPCPPAPPKPLAPFK